MSFMDLWRCFEKWILRTFMDFSWIFNGIVSQLNISDLMGFGGWAGCYLLACRIEEICYFSGRSMDLNLCELDILKILCVWNPVRDMWSVKYDEPISIGFSPDVSLPSIYIIWYTHSTICIYIYCTYIYIHIYIHIYIYITHTKYKTCRAESTI